tara:strand:+ start:116 stop:355 length:240 start_codon:yes stop_codon:yes gene_type:complete
MTKEIDNYRAFNDVNLSNARGENEPYKAYKLRLKQNERILKMYNTIGRDAFRELFPAGVGEAMKSAKEVNDNPPKEINK